MKIWYDISGIYHWHGNFTGIQRVVYNLGKELNHDDIESGFFIYKHGNFHEVNFEELEARLQSQVAQPTTAKKSSEGVRLGALHHHAIVTLKDIARNSPAEPYLRATYHKARKTYRAAKSSASPNRAKHSIFKAEDTVIVVDGNWQFHGYAEAIIAAKSNSGFRLVHFVHDLTPIKNPALASIGADKILGEYFEKIIPACDIIIADSESSKRDTKWFIDKLQLKEPVLRVLTLGDNFMKNPVVGMQKPHGQIAQDFILAVSTIEIRKNYISLYYAYKLAIEKGIKLPQLVIVGKKGWMAEEAYALLTKDPELSDQVIILRGIPDQELEWLYANCMFTVFPSFYEGWGLPVAESFLHGKACISSNTSSMPEVGKDLAVYVSPYNPQEIMEAISELSSEPSKLYEIEKKIKATYQPRPWSNSYKDLLSLITIK